MSDLFNEKQEENVSNNEESLSLQGNMSELHDFQAIDADDYDSPIEEYHKEDSVSYNDELNEKYTDVNPSEPEEKDKTFSYNNAQTSSHAECTDEERNKTFSYNNASLYGDSPIYERKSYDSHYEKPKKEGNPLLIGCAALLAFSIGFASMLGIHNLLSKYNKSDVKIQTVEPNQKPVVSGLIDVSGTVSKVMPSVVSITSVTDVTDIFGFQQGKQEGAGSGFIVAKEKDKIYIATNNHVVAGATNLNVGFCDTTNAKAEIVGTDTDSDLALISVKIKDIEEETRNHIKVAVLGNSDDLKVGQNVIAIGNALGYGQSVTTGVISAKNREVSFTDGTMTLLQTDAAINPGNSGGVLTDITGAVVGINNAKLSDTSVEGMGYAIPVSVAQPILEELKNTGKVNKDNAGFLGITGRTIDSSTSSAMGFPIGVYIVEITKNSPAEKAELHAGDVITSINDEKVSSMNGLKEKISRKKKGDEVKITYERLQNDGKYKEYSAKVVLGKASDFPEATESTTEEKNNPTQEHPFDDGSDIEDWFNQFGY